TKTRLSDLGRNLTKGGNSRRRPPTYSRLLATLLSISKPCLTRLSKLQPACVTPNEVCYFGGMETFLGAPRTMDLAPGFERAAKRVRSRRSRARPSGYPRSKTKQLIFPTFSPIPNTHS